MPYFEFVITQKHHGSFNVTKTNGMLTPSLPESSLCAHVMGPDYILHGSVFFFFNSNECYFFGAVYAGLFNYCF